MNEQQEVGFRGLEDDAQETRSTALAAVDQAMGLVERAQLDSQVATAKAYPRSIAQVLKEAQGMATLDAKTAAGMFYTLKRGKGKDAKAIMGPSVRLAEVVAVCWGNLRVESGVEDEGLGRSHLTAVAVAFDLEKNVAVRIRVQRRVTTKEGHRFGDDMVGVTGNAAVSVAFRNAVFRVVPRVFVDRLFQLAQDASTGKGTLEEKRARGWEFFKTRGVTEAELFAFLEVKGWDDVTLEHVIQMAGAATAIKDGMATVDELFRPEQESEGARDLTQDLKAGKGKPKAAAGDPKAKPTPQGEPMTAAELADVEETLAAADRAGVLQLPESMAFEKMEQEGRWDELRKAAADLMARTREADAKRAGGGA